MAVENNGKAVVPGPKGMNGHGNGHPAVPRSKTTNKQKSFGLFSIISRLFTWYSIITVLFRCPATVDLLTDSSPRVCKPYFQFRSAVLPHLEPYYNTYAAPYVETARPYYNTLDKRVITPATALGTKYGAPRVAQAKAFGQAQWEKTLQPQVSKYQDIVKAKYDETLAPHFDKAYTAAWPYYDIAKTNALQTYYENILPAYNAVQPYALQGYGYASDFTVNTALPYSKWAWTTGGIFLDRTVFPKLRILYGENVEPQLVRISERLGRYREGKKIQAVVDEVDSSSSASSASETFSSISASISSAHATTSTITSSVAYATPSPEEPVSTPLSEAEIRDKAQKVVVNDLKTWQEKFSKAADEGSDELGERITEITERLLKNQAEKVGSALNIQLEETVKSSFKAFKFSAISIVENSKDSETSEEELNAAIRKAGVAIKEKGQAVRIWRQNYDQETNSLVSKAAEDTLQILDHIRDLGLQEIGMRWAWTDGITHKDWTKYHALKPKFDEWRHEVEQVAINHLGLGKARAASEEVVNQAMETAGDAAEELGRLKETARWKISTGDSSDDWSTKIMPAAAVVAGKKIADQFNDASEAILGTSTSQGTMESAVSVASSSFANAVSSGSSIVSQDASSPSSSVAGTSQGTMESVVSVESASASRIIHNASGYIIGTQKGNIESATSVIKASASSIVDQASSSVIGTPKESAESVASAVKASASSIADQVSSSVIGTAQGTVESAVSVAKESASSIANQVSSSIIGTPQGSVESIVSVATASASSLSDKVSSSVVETSQGIVESLVSVTSEGVSSPSDKASSSIVGSEPGIVEKASSSIISAASVVASSVSSLSNSASSIFSAASTSLSSLSSSASTTISSSASGASSDFSSSLSSASSTASKKVWGGAMAQYVEARQIIYDDVIEETPDDETYSERIASMASEAGDRFADVTRAVSEALLKTTSTQGSAESVTSLGSELYSSAIVAASSALYGPEQGAGESVASVASSRYTNAVSAASIAIYGTPVPLAAQASAAYSDGLSRASDYYTHAKSIVSAQISGEPQPVHQEVFGSVEKAYSDSIQAVNSRLQDALSASSSAVYGTPLSPHQSLYSAASSFYYGAPQGALESISSVAVSKLNDGLSHASAQFSNAKSYVSAVQTDAPSKEKLLAQMQNQYYAGIGMAHARYSEFLELGSSVVGATPTPFHESLYSKASAGIVGTPTPAYQSALSSASANYDQVVAIASSKLNKILAGASSIAGVPSSEAIPTSSLIAVASSSYRVAVAQASQSYSSISVGIVSKLNDGASAISSAIYGSETPWAESIASQAGEKYNSVASQASSAIHGSETPWTASVASQASENWEALITKASSQIYGAPTPYFVTRSLLSQASEYAGFATSGVASQYSAVQSLISELVVGREPDFTESVYSRFSDLYYTGAGEIVSSASSYASEAYASASSVAQSIFTPPPTLEAILDSASRNVNDVVQAASIRFYGSQTGYVEAAQSSVASAYNSVQSAASEKVYGTQAGYGEVAQKSVADVAFSAQKALSEAIYGTPTGTVESVANAAGEAISQATSYAGDAYSSASAVISSAIYGPEQGAMESAQKRLSDAIESARAKLGEFAAMAGDEASEAIKKASEGVEDFASSVSSVVGSATARAKDEL